MKQHIIDILFLTYLTQYNSNEILGAFTYNDLNDFIGDYIRHKHENGTTITYDFVRKCQEDARERYEEMKFLGISFISYYSKEYPQILKEISKPPPLLYLRGTLKQGPNVAIVGSRKISRFADETVHKIVNIFLDNNYGIVSGLAYGIDKMAHTHTIKRKGYTIAVLPNSLDHIYPKEHLSLANEILDCGGAIISELPKGYNLGAKGFVQRNRIQSGLSEIVFPVEMGTKSGTMHTVQFCVQQKKKLFVIRPSDDRKNLSEYEGIFEILSRKYEHLTILPPDFTWNDINIKQSMPNSGELWDVVISRMGKHTPTGNGETIELFILETKKLIKSKETEIALIVKQATRNEISLLVKEFKSYIQTRIQDLTQKYLSEYPQLTRRELEKPIKNSLKELDIKLQSISES